MRFIGIIPARYASVRFPGKPLADMHGKPVIRRVYEQVAGWMEDVVVATDDRRIFDAVASFGGNAVMTSESHKSGTDRCYEAYVRTGATHDAVVNIQGDEPFIRPSQIELLKACFDDPDTQIATLVKPFTPEDGLDALFNPNAPKVAVNSRMQALYFSRSVIPCLRGKDPAEWLTHHTYYRHIGLYAYKAEALKAITSLPQSKLEIAESLEQLRWLENGYVIKTGVTQEETVGIDTPDDLQRALAMLETMETTKSPH
jgi:3-deoxy-manno-octulosonate cytidylyltransferase (CMP-KDO synthetase)